MYDELVKDLRENHDKYFARDMQAADAIVKLQKRVPKTPHGRLIDADANLSVMRRVLDNPYTDLGKIDTAMLKACIKMFEEAPTVIEAEEGK